jgi:serine/threonine protein kinase
MSLGSLGYIGSYRLLEVVNRGQTCCLWRAYDDEKREFVCIKTLLESFAKQREQVQILKWEYDVAAKFSHPKLVKFKQYDWYQKKPYIVMEWFSAANLKMWVNRGYEEYCKFLPQVIPDMTDAILYLHQNGWTHRDVKPDNYLFDTETGMVKMIDFALARRIVTGIGRLFTLRSKVQGTASYMAPEQIRGLPPDASADIYSLGCTFYELLTTRLPFTGNSINELLAKHLEATPPTVTQRNRNVTPEFSELLKLIMAKRPDDRPKKTSDLMRLIQTTRIFRRPPSKEDLV